MSRFGDATGWCKELKALPIINLSLTLIRLFHKDFNKAVENIFLYLVDGRQPQANGLPSCSAIFSVAQGFSLNRAIGFSR
jgi:hypothetical protein